MTTEKLIDKLKEANPYPEWLFTEPTPEDWENIGQFLKQHGFNPDSIFAKFGRQVWENAAKFIETELKPSGHRCRNCGTASKSVYCSVQCSEDAS
jgi:hypothetical protein